MMAAMLTLILTGLLRGIRAQHALVLENLALRHQLTVLQRTAPRPRLRLSFAKTPSGGQVVDRSALIMPRSNRSPP